MGRAWTQSWSKNRNSLPLWDSQGVKQGGGLGARRWQGSIATAALVLSIRERQSLEITPRQVTCLLDSPQQDANQKLLSFGLRQQLLRPITILLPRLQPKPGLSCPCPQSGLGGFSYMGLQLKSSSSPHRCLYRTVIKHVCFILD